MNINFYLSCDSDFYLAKSPDTPEYNESHHHHLPDGDRPPKHQYQRIEMGKAVANE